MRKNTYVCPYCFTTHSKSELCFRCVNATCKKKPDHVYAKYCYKAPELRQPAFEGRKKWFGKKKYVGECPYCGRESGQLLCPSCHNVLPGLERSIETKLFTVVGGMDAGKSSYLAVLLHEFKRKGACMLNGVASFMDDTSARVYEEQFLRYLYPCIGTDPSIRLPKTKSSLAGSTYIGANRPILMDFKRVEEQKKYTFVFYDEAGEDFEEETLMFTMSEQIAASNGIFFFLDPLKISYVRNRLQEAKIKGASTTEEQYGSDANVILLRLIKVLRAKYKLLEEERISVPVAVILPKLDVLTSLLSRSSPLLRSSMHYEEKGYARQEGFDVHEELGGLLHEWGQQEFLYHLAANFENYQLFAVSAFGNNPDEYGRFYHPKPVRIEDPFLWMLAQMGVIRAL